MARQTKKKTTTAKRLPKRAARKKRTPERTPPAKNTRPRAKRSRESQAARRARALRLLAELRRRYPTAQTALHHNSALELLAATILSAQCTDERVNLVTPGLFRRYPDAADYAAADPHELETLIRSTGFFRNKTKSLIGLGQALRDEFGGEVPDTMDELLTLPGVARKTANCVLGTWFHENVGIVVDTHVGRLALRLRLLTSARDDKDAVRIERDLMDLFPPDSWTYLAHALIDHGREVCTARKPKCGGCTLAPDCPMAGTFGTH
ncbi:MAG: endonuclease III [Planctomycetes bacterium]|nr:endonuclease III [Planctomycetota bacterium]